jgi:hypothetical protein
MTSANQLAPMVNINMSIETETGIPALDDKVKLCAARGHPAERVDLGL